MLKTEVDSCFQSVSEGKKQLASTLTGLGVTTAADATFNTINSNIVTLAKNRYSEGQKSVDTSGTAAADKILKGYTAVVNGTRLTGTMPNNGAIGAADLTAGGSYTIPAGYTSGGTVTAASLASQTGGTATAEDIASGKTAWVGGVQVVGTKREGKVIYDLGINTEFDLTSYEGYQSFTAANFICEQLQGTVEANCGGYATESVQWPTASTSATVSKSYDASNGRLTATETITTKLLSTYAGTTVKTKLSVFPVHAYLIIEN